MNNKNLHFSITYLPLLIRLKCCETVCLPDYLGSTLRGVMGWVLSSNREVYEYIFENRRFGGGYQDIVNPYIIEPPRYGALYWEGDELIFGFTLIGNSLQYAAAVMETLIQTRIFKLGFGRKKFELVEIMQGQRLKTIWHADNPKEMKNMMIEKISDDICKDSFHCSVNMVSPLRIRRKGTLLTEIDFSVIIRSITRRMTELTNRYGGFVNEEEAAYLCDLSKSIQVMSAGFYVYKMDRFSNRRNEKMDWSGLMGAMTLEGDMKPFQPWLNAARILHIGRNVTFGFGKIEVIF